MTPGQRAYEADVERRPHYHTGEPRRTWYQLSAVMQQSWEKVDPSRAAIAKAGEQ